MIPIPIPIPRVDTEKKPDHVGEGLLQGVNKWCDHVGDGALKLWRKPQEGHRREGALGAVKGVGTGMLDLATGVGKGACDFLGSTLEGVRHTPDAVADKVNRERKHNKHGVDGEGRGELLESYVEEEQEPEHLGEGLVAGAQGFGKGIVSGVKDLVNRPLEGAKEGGAVGFAKGAGQGLMGFGTKAASGTLDFATSVLSGAKNTPDAIGRAVNRFQERGAAGSGSAASSSSGGTGSFSEASGARSSGAPLFQGGAAPASGKFAAFSGAGNVLGSEPSDPAPAASSNEPAQGGG